MLGILLISTFSGIYPLLTSNQETTVVETPKLSDGISIKSPIDGERYYKSEEGHYPATFSFEHDIGGTIPQGWEEVSTGEPETDVKVMTEKYGHKQVLELRDATSSYMTGVKQAFSTSQVSGTIEYWVRTNRNTRWYYFLIIDDAGQGCRYNFHSKTSMVQYYDGDYHSICPWVKDTWVHFKIDFDTENDIYFMTVDGIKYGPLDMYGVDPSALSQIQFYTGGSASGLYMWIDAVGYSWDPMYNIGDNIACNGDFSATYSFENDEYGNIPDGWNVYEPSATSVQVIDGIDSHKKVVQIYDGNAETYPWMCSYFNNEKTSGTVEWWFRQNDNTKLNQFLLVDGSETAFINILTSYSTNQWIQCYDGSIHNICPFSSNTWYHIRVKFDIGTAGDGTNDWHLSVNGIGYGSFGYQGIPNTMDYIWFRTDYGITGWTYIDAVGYSWDPNYFVGENTLENGYYPATYGFENDDVGDIPEEWTFSGSSNCYANVLGVKEGHKKVLELYDHGTGADIYYNQLFSSSQTSGTVEAWMYTEWAEWGTSLQIWSGSTGGPRLYLYMNSFRVYTPSGWNYIRPASSNTWYHVRIDFECGNGIYKGLSADTFWVHIDGTRYGPYSFNNALSSADRIRGWTGGSNPSPYSSYLDAIGYSWRDGYEIGDNLEEGMLLEFEPDNYNSMSYSLDEGTGISILGDTVISYPDPGNHIIEVIGIDTYGNSYSGSTEFSIGNCLIGSTNRMFPKTDLARLGYTIETVELPSNTPHIRFAITDILTSRNDNVDIKLLVDNEEFLSVTENIGFRSEFNVYVDELESVGAHQIVIQLSVGTYYNLEYICIANLNFKQYNFYEDKTYTPIQNYSSKESYYAMDVSFYTNFYYECEDLKIDTGQPNIGTSMIAIISPKVGEEKPWSYNPELPFEEFYIYSTKIQWKVIDPNGNYLTSEQIDSVSEVKSNYQGVVEGQSEQILYWELFYDLLCLIPKFGTAISAFGFLKYLPTQEKSAGTIDQPAGYYEYEAKWTAGTKPTDPFEPPYGGGYIPEPWFTKSSMFVKWAPELIPDNAPSLPGGYYQVQYTWTLTAQTVINNLGDYGVSPNGFEISGEYFLNFYYIPP